MSDNTTSTRIPGRPPALDRAEMQAVQLRPIPNVGESAPSAAQEPQGEALAPPVRAEAHQPAKSVSRVELGRFEQHSGQKIIFTEVNKGGAVLLEIRSEFGTFEGRAIALTTHALPSLQGAIDRYRERATERELAKGKRVFT